ncbi:MAG: LD-carboxypeptidase [Acidobacteriota bacterium]
MINRREFARLATLAAAVAGTTSVTATARTSPRLIKPRRLSPGDTVGMVLPASTSFDANMIRLASSQLEAIGFKVVVGKHAFDKVGYFAGTDRDRASDINAMFGDDRINGIFAFTGGWGSPRVLPYLDWSLIQRNPKVFIGYSDITGLLNPIHQRTGLVTFHGPVAASRIDPYSLENLKKVIMTAEPIGVLANPGKKPDELINRDWSMYTINGGKATGPIVGGNLTLVSTLMGTPYEVDTEGALVFLEDVHEELYRIDRMLTQMALGGKFDRIAGVVFGRCSECPVTGPSFSLEEILRDRFEKLGVPVLVGLAFGHIDKKLTLPIGLPASLDADAMTVTVNESAVV